MQAVELAAKIVCVPPGKHGVECEIAAAIGIGATELDEASELESECVPFLPRVNCSLPWQAKREITSKILLRAAQAKL